jgi:hypothetical protein
MSTRPFGSPVTVKWYGVREMTLPSYLIAQATTLVAALALLLVVHWIVEPPNGLFATVRESLLRDAPWSLHLVPWLPAAILALAIPDVIEVAIMLERFRVKSKMAGE